MPLPLPRVPPSLTTRIMLLVSMLVLAGIWGLAVPLVAFLQADQKRTIAENLSTTLDYATAHIDQEMRLRINAVDSMAATVGTGMEEGPARVQHLLERLQFSPAIFPGGLLVIDRHGEAIADFPTQAGRRGDRFAQTDYVRTALAGTATIGQPAAAPDPSDGTVTHVAVPIRTAGAIAGVLAAPVYPQDSDLLGVLEATRLGDGGDFVVVSPGNGLIISATDRSRVLTRLAAPGPVREGFENAVVTENPAGREVLQVSSTMETTGWTIIASIPTTEAFAPVAALERRIYLGALGMTVLIALLLHVALKRLLRPLVEAGSAMRRMSGSDAPLAPIPVRRDDEIGHLTRNFNRLIAERDRLDASLRQSERRFRDIVDSLDGIVWEADAASGRFTHVSGQAERLLGYPAEDWKEPGFWAAHLCAEDRDWAPDYRARHTAAGQPCDFEYRFVARDGAVRWLHDRVTVVAEDGRSRWLRGITVDVTARKCAEHEMLLAKAEAERANNAKSRFLASASHDLRQPLAALNLYVGVLDFKLGPDEASLRRSIKDCVASLSEMLNDLLDLSKLEAGVVKPEATDFSLAQTLAHIVANHAPGAQAKGLRLHCAHSALNAHTDRILFGRMLGNLVGNAVRYTETGGVLVGCRRRDGRHWVEVWDTGVGFPPEKTTEIFEEFRQLGNDARNRDKGSGLGLAIVAKAATLLGLRIRVRSRPGRGSMFAIEVPLGGAAQSCAAADFTPRPLRIALAEDDRLVIDALGYALTEVGHEVLPAPSGRALLAELDGKAPDLVISDYRLAGGETGFDVIRAVRDVFGEALPALLVTGDTDPALMRSMSREGIRVQHKPIELDALLRCLAELAGEQGEAAAAPRLRTA